MKETLIQFETAKLAKEKGFNVPTYSGFGERGGKALGRLSTYSSGNLVYARPTQSLLQKWLREEHGICAYLDWREMNAVICTLYNDDKIEVLSYWSIICVLPEKALEDLLFQSLKTIK